MEIRLFSSEIIRSTLSMKEAIEAMKLAYSDFSAGKVADFKKVRLDVPNHGTNVAIMSSSAKTLPQNLSIKVISYNPRNRDRGLPAIHAIILAIDETSGIPIAIFEGGTLTSVRTGAGSGAATDVLARSNVETVAIIGCGVQAETQLEAMFAVRDLSNVKVFDIERSRAEIFTEKVVSRCPEGIEISVAKNANQAISDADIICTATTSLGPVFDGRKLKAGSHINAIGSFAPTMREVDEHVLKQSLIVVDSRKHVLEEAGDLIIPIQKGELDKEHIHAELGEIILGLKAGRVNNQQITLFKSVGLGIQDAYAISMILEKSITEDICEVISL